MLTLNKRIGIKILKLLKSFAYNTAVNDTIKQTPFEMMFFRKPKIPDNQSSKLDKSDFQLDIDPYNDINK